MDHPQHGLSTESQNLASRHIDQMDTEQIVRLINEEDQTVALKVKEALPQIAMAVQLITKSLSSGGRLFYIGAGTSGRLGILDASECPPTYGTDPSLVQGIIAGGTQAITSAVEGAEDNRDNGARDIDLYGITDKDAVVGIAASGRTPYVIGAMQRAFQIGSKVIGISNNAGSAMSEFANVMIEVQVGPEVVMGSTRMKAGTAQKMVLNMLTTAAMIQMGKVYDNLMVDVQPTNEKLIRRAKRMIGLATDAPDEMIDQIYKEAGGHVKTAIVMILAQVNVNEAKQRLQKAGGFVRKALDIRNNLL